MTATLIYVVGASGSGKDSLLSYARKKLNGDPRVIFAHRYITRPVDVGNENHIALSHEEFSVRLHSDLFALNWHSNGFHYGIGREINLWLEKGISVVVNGSREYLTEARQRYPDLLVVWIDVSRSVLQKRLLLRGRESAEEIERRLYRNEQFQDMMRNEQIIQNNSQLKFAGEGLVELICNHISE